MLVWKELRDLGPRCALALALVALATWRLDVAWRSYDLGNTLHLWLASAAVGAARGWAFQGHLYGAAWFFGLWACVLGFDALAGEGADRTWVFLRARPAGRVRFLAAKLLPRLALVLVPYLGYFGAVIGYAGFGSPMPEYPAWAHQSALADAWYLYTSPPYPFLFAIAWGAAQVVLCLAVAVLVGSLWAHRGIALGAAVVANLLLWTVEVWVLRDAMTRVLDDWQAPGGAFCGVCLLTLAALAAAAHRTLTYDARTLGSA